MSNRIPQSFLDDLIERSDLVATIAKRVHLKRAGKEFTACCPFHDEKTPSFTVSPQKQFYHCFGCGAHGNVIRFIMEYDNLPFQEAVELLASQFGLEIPQQLSSTKPQTNSKPLYQLMDQTVDFYQQQLKNAPQVIDYIKNRKISHEMINLFKLGYAPDAWSKLLETYPQQQPLLEKTGMCLKSQSGKVYDRFRNRLMFPVHDTRGRVIAYGGRALSDDDNPKYLNSPETAIFHKGRTLYGLFETCQSNKTVDQLIVVEGYMDVISLFQHGFPYAVATMGTAITTQNLSQLLRYTPKITFCFDGDRAGRQAALKALGMSLPVMQDGVSIHFMFLPQEHDPDSFIQKNGHDQFKQLLSQAKPLETFFFDYLQTQGDIQSIEGKAKIAAVAKSMLSPLPNGVYLQLLNQKLSHLLGANVNRPPNPPTRQDKKQQQRRKPRLSPAQLATNLLLQDPTLAELVEDISSYQDYQSEELSLFIAVYQHFKQHPKHSVGQLLEHWQNREDYDALIALASQATVLDQQALKAEFTGSINRLQDSFREEQIQQLMHKATSSGLTNEEKLKLQQLISAR